MNSREQIQVNFLMRRFGLTSIQANLIAGLHYGEAV